MISAPLPANEDERLEALYQLDILDTLEEQAYDDLTLLAAQICDVPIALVSLIDKDRQWFKSHYGLPVHETPRDLAFCAHAIHGDEMFVVSDSDKDERFHDNPLVTGEPHVKFYAGMPLILENNMHIGTLCVIDDHARNLTEKQKKALEALSRQVVSQLELRMKVKELKGLDKTKDEFISMVSHELRTPLTAINGSLALLTNVMSNDVDINNMADIAYRNSQRLLNIVNDILDVARMDAGKFELKIDSVDMLSLINEAVELMKPYVEKCDCEMALQLPPTDFSSLNVMADRQRLLQVMSNFISNAAKFTKANDTIIVSMDMVGSEVCVSVTDHGQGIAKEKSSQVFSRFSQISHCENTKMPGTGLGLNICKSIIEQHKGRIGFDSKENEHTRFYFCLPIVE